MKSIQKYILMLLVMTFNVVNAQTFKENFFGEDFMQYKGSLLKLKKDSHTGFMYTFYSHIKYCQALNDVNVIYADSIHKFSTVKDSLINRTFKVEDIVGKDGNTFTGRSDSYLNKPIFVLKDTKTGQTIYYKYDKKYKHNFPFLVSEITIDINALCSKIESKTDDFTDEVTISTPEIEDLKISSVVLYKTINSGNVRYLLGLKTNGKTINVGENGVIILFDDGTKMNKPTVKIDVDAGEKEFYYS